MDGRGLTILAILVHVNIIAGIYLWRARARCTQADPPRHRRRAQRAGSRSVSAIARYGHPFGVLAPLASYCIFGSVLLNVVRQPWRIVQGTACIAWCALAYTCVCWLPAQTRARLHRGMIDRMLRAARWGVKTTPWWKLTEAVQALFKAFPRTVACMPFYLVADLYYRSLLYPFIAFHNDNMIAVTSVALFVTWRLLRQTRFWARWRARCLRRLCTWGWREAKFIGGRIIVLCFGRRTVDAFFRLLRSLEELMRERGVVVVNN